MVRNMAEVVYDQNKTTAASFSPLPCNCATIPTWHQTSPKHVINKYPLYMPIYIVLWVCLIMCVIQGYVKCSFLLGCVQFQVSSLKQSFVVGGWMGGKGMSYCKWAYISSVQHKCLEVICILEVVISSFFYSGISIKDPELDYTNPSMMNQPQTYRASSFYVIWVRDTLVSNNFFPLCVCERVRVNNILDIVHLTRGCC